MSDMYRDHLLDHARRPRHFGVLPDATVTWHAANASCGDIVDLYMRLTDDGRIESISFTGRGCVISQAATSILLEVVQGKSKKDVLAMEPKDVMGLLGVEPGPMRLNCALLSLRALHQVLQ